MIVVALSRNLLFWFVIIGGLAIVGVAQLYVPGSKYIRYIIPLAAGLLFLHAVMDRMRIKLHDRRSQLSVIVPWAVAFTVVGFISAAVNWEGIGSAIIGLKGYFQMWAFFFAFILIQWKQEILNSLPRAVFIIALLQLPFVLHQYLVLVPMRTGLSGLVPVDVVSGTFGGAKYGGGANAVLAAFLLIVIACLLGLWKHGALSGWKLLVYSLLMIFPVFINEAKISAVYLPVIFVALFYKDIIQRPGRFIIVATAASGIIAALLTALTLLHPSGRLQSWSDLVEFVYEGQTASIAERSGRGADLSRWTALTFWAKEHVSSNPIHILVGHGPGASRTQDSVLDLADTLAEKRYRGLNIGYTAISALLWDTGILGLATILGLFYSAFRVAGKLAVRYKDLNAFYAGMFEGLRAGILVLAISLLHKDFFVFHIPYQTLVFLMLGYLVVVGKLSQEDNASKNAGSAVRQSNTVNEH